MPAGIRWRTSPDEEAVDEVAEEAPEEEDR